MMDRFITSQHGLLMGHYHGAKPPANLQGLKTPYQRLDPK
jgi:hypothetical protein